MKHKCHCGFHERIREMRASKRFGLLAVALIVLHLLFHIVECLIIPALFVAASSNL